MANIKTKDRLSALESGMSEILAAVRGGVVPTVQKTETAAKRDLSGMIPESIRAKMEPSSPGSDFLRCTAQGFSPVTWNKKGGLVYVLPGGKKDHYLGASDAAAQAITLGALERAVADFKALKALKV